MTRPVSVGADGSPAGLAAADWGAREALLRNLPLRLIHAWEWQPYPPPPADPEAARRWSEGVPHEVAVRLRRRYPTLDISADHVLGPPRDVLCKAAEEAEVLVIGTMGMGRIAGFLLGSVCMATVTHAESPVVLVRSGTPDEQHAPEDHPGSPAHGSAARTPRPVVIGLDLTRPCDKVISFAFEAAALRAAPLVVVHGWNPPPYYAYGLGAALAWGADISAEERETLRQALLPWSEKHPGVDLVQEPVIGEPAHHLLDSAAHAQLVVIGRRIPPTRASWPRIGHVAHAVLHHCPAPVAVVPHG